LKDVENFPHLSKGKSRDIAAEKLNISGRTAEKAVKVVTQVDELKVEGKEDQAKELVDTLNKSVDRAYREISTDKLQPSRV